MLNKNYSVLNNPKIKKTKWIIKIKSSFPAMAENAKNSQAIHANNSPTVIHSKRKFPNASEEDLNFLGQNIAPDLNRSRSLSRERTSPNKELIDDGFIHPRRYSKQPPSTENARPSTANRFETISNPDDMNIDGDTHLIQSQIFLRPAGKDTTRRRSTIDNTNDPAPPTATKSTIKPPPIHSKGIQIKALLKTLIDNRIDNKSFWIKHVGYTFTKEPLVDIFASTKDTFNNIKNVLKTNKMEFYSCAENHDKDAECPVAKTVILPSPNVPTERKWTFCLLRRLPLHEICQQPNENGIISKKTNKI
ncbi:hypothetical protein KQX54_008282 [Cotesia glomerata]|uniref:Uncharacterized protein n=1 Tax=Cotesia glomerata TaxID=32391 RepID=A0AAV7IUZ6_COTGL|nr:hypothetical protein KQX54_008282 [Cotesia glomerata]